MQSRAHDYSAELAISSYSLSKKALLSVCVCAGTTELATESWLQHGINQARGEGASGTEYMRVITFSLSVNKNQEMSWHWTTVSQSQHTNKAPLGKIWKVIPLRNRYTLMRYNVYIEVHNTIAYTPVFVFPYLSHCLLV